MPQKTAEDWEPLFGAGDVFRVGLSSLRAVDFWKPKSLRLRVRGPLEFRLLQKMLSASLSLSLSLSQDTFELPRGGRTGPGGQLQ